MSAASTSRGLPTPVLVLLPGMDGTGELFAPLLAALGSACTTQVIAFPCDQPLHYRDLELWVRDRLPRDRPFVLLAESFSGPIAVSVAASQPPGLKGLILCASFVRNPRPGLAWTRELIKWMPVFSALAPWVFPLLLGRKSPQPLRQMLQKATMAVTAPVWRMRLRAVLAVDASAEFAKVAIPVLYLRALRDRLVPKAAGDAVVRAFPETAIQALDAPHLVLQVVPVRAAAVVLGFVRECGTSTRQ